MLEVEDEAVLAVAMGAVDEVVEVVAVEVAVETTMTTTTPHPRPSRDPPDADVGDNEPTGSSATPRCNNNWPKSCKINAKRPQVDALQVLPPPTRSRRHTKTDDALP